MRCVTEAGRVCIHCGQQIVKYQGEWKHRNPRLDRGWMDKAKKRHVDHLPEPAKEVEK